jgi:LmbE family N-acetylglucosaminyl deacetylase
MWFEDGSWSRQVSAAWALLRAANGLGSRGAEALWSASSLAAGKVFQPRAQRWASSGHERVVAIAPHPDDEAAGCAGTLIRHREAGDLVRAAVVTDGSRSRALGFDSSAMAEQREREASAAAARIGAQCHWMGLREGDWSDQDGRAAIHRALADVDPTIIYAPSNIDFHPEHRRVAQTLAATLSVSSLKPEVRIYAVQVPLTPLLTNMIHDVSDLETSIRLVFGCYASQQISLKSSFRARRYAARFYQVNGLAEGFCAMPAELYVALHKRPLATFKPMAIRAWTDPLTLAIGIGERLHWNRRRSRR